MAKLFGSSQNFSVVWFLQMLGTTILWSLLNAIVLSFQYFFKKPKVISGQVALITGGGRGLGRQLAIRLANEGCNIAVVDVDLVTAQQTAVEAQKLGVNAEAYYVSFFC